MSHSLSPVNCHVVISILPVLFIQQGKSCKSQCATKLHQIRWKSYHFLRKCHGHSMTWTCTKSMSCPSMENKWNLDKWHGIVMEFGVNLDQTAVNLWHEMTWNFHENPFHIFFRVVTIRLICHNIVQTDFVYCCNNFELWVIV